MPKRTLAEELAELATSGPAPGATAAAPPSHVALATSLRSNASPAQD